MAKLNWFYSLELNQVDLYMAQSKMVNDIYISKVLERSSYIEQQHVDNIAAQIRKYGSEPTIFGDIVSPLLGKTAGNITAAFGIVPLLKADILLEKKAMSDYKDLILKVGKDHALFSVLWANLIDEDLHTAWFSNKVQELEACR
ncbi:cytochrome B [Dehalobacter sp. 12DCB1]|uniref:ferritin-like domain-containing protein n=1 Tax=unclassified Dehalobacter TaxID=2635733 RepID=UPI000A00BD75|nr:MULTISPECIES: ferritin-like domain-containing protein [unclassified Dehalobacter]TCX50929.1 cytochrome B [Dehalobacter sp. 12DCB1]